MRQLFLRTCLTALSGVALAACAPDLEPRDPRTLPYTLHPVRDLGTNAHVADLDGDGFDEVVRNHTPSDRPPGIQAVWMTTHDGRTIDQVNFEGTLLPLHFLDLERDGVLEIVAPYVRNDSLFLAFIDAGGRKQGGFFLADGEPRVEPGGVLPWDPILKEVYLTDTNADGREELVTVISTGFARYPRGVLVHRLPGGELIGRKAIGSFPTSSFVGNFDGDGGPELVMSTGSPNNGAVAGGFDDAHSYIIAFDLDPEPEVLWSKETGGLWTGTNLTYADFDGDGRRDLLICATTASSRPEEARFEIVEPGTWRTLRHRSIAEPLRWSQTVDLDRDTRPEVVAIRSPDEVWAFDGQLERVQRRRVAKNLDLLEVGPDMDGDGVEEIAVFTKQELLLLDPALRVKAAYPPIRVRGGIGVMRRGLGVSPYLLVEREEGVVALELVENRFFWLYRYGPYALWALGIAAVLGAVLGGRSLYRRNQLLQRVYPAAVDSAANGLLVLDAEGRVVLVNAMLCDGLGIERKNEVEGKPYGVALSGAPALVAFLRRVFGSDPPRHHAEEVALGANGQQVVHYVTAEPVLFDHGQPPYWLIALRNGDGNTASLDAKMWALMAKEVTHDFKTPLNTILLTAQGLQTAYRKQAPHASATLDPYTDRIVERVNALRWKARQFMKILDVEALDLVRSDLSEVVSEMRETMARDLPLGIQLVFCLEPNLPPALLDREQIQTALENLVANAFPALGDGGTVTVSTRSVSDLRLAHTAYEPADYLVLEVQDNGKGIAEADRPRVFEPGFTTSEFGTGLGLALVWRVALHHGGFVEVESERGEGSIFSLYLPSLKA